MKPGASLNPANSRQQPVCSVSWKAQQHMRHVRAMLVRKGMQPSALGPREAALPRQQRWLAIERPKAGKAAPKGDVLGAACTSKPSTPPAATSLPTAGETGKGVPGTVAADCMPMKTDSSAGASQATPAASS